MAYEFDAGKYKKASKHQKEWGSSRIAQLPLTGKESVLDLGCGDGVLSEQIARRLPQGRVVGIDACEGMIRTAKALEGERLTFRKMDINEMDFSQEFDIIFSNAALHWVLDHALLLRNSYRALKPGGSIFWDFAGDGNCSLFFEVVRQVMAQEEFALFFRGFRWPWFMPRKEEYEALVRPVGFAKAQVAQENKDRFFADAGEMTAWINQPSIVPFLAAVPESSKETFRHEVVRQMLQRSRQADGTYFETFRRIRVTARK